MTTPCAVLYNTKPLASTKFPRANRLMGFTFFPLIFWWKISHLQTELDVRERGKGRVVPVVRVGWVWWRPWKVSVSLGTLGGGGAADSRGV